MILKNSKGDPTKNRLNVAINLSLFDKIGFLIGHLIFNLGSFQIMPISDFACLYFVHL